MNEKKFTHSMNYQKNPRNKYLTKTVIQNILYKCGIYDEVQNLAIYQRSLTHKSYVVNDNNSVLKYNFLEVRKLKISAHLIVSAVRQIQRKDFPMLT